MTIEELTEEFISGYINVRFRSEHIVGISFPKHLQYFVVFGQCPLVWLCI